MNAEPFIHPQMHGPSQPSLEYGPGPNAYGPGAGMPPHGVPPPGAPMPGALYGAPPYGAPPQQLQQGGPQPWAMNPPSAPPLSGQYAGYGGAAMEGFDDGTSELLKYERDHRPPKHGQLSWAIMILASISLLLTLMSLFTKEWRSNAIGVVGYTGRRSWGLFSVVGAKRTQSHYEIQQFTCRAFGGLSVGGICNSPICVWYKLKCQVYIQLMWVSYTAGLFVGIGVIIHMLCMYWTYNLTPRLIRWAGTWWFMDIFFQVGAIAFWSLMTEDLFASLDTKAIYPAPSFSMSFFFCCFSAFLLLVVAFLGILLMKIWPEDDDDDDSDDELLAEDNYEFAMMDKRGCPAGAGQPVGYVGGPPAGYVGGPPAGYVGGPQLAHRGGEIPMGGATLQHPAPINPSLGVSAAGHGGSQGSAGLQRADLSDGARQTTE